MSRTKNGRHPVVISCVSPAFGRRYGDKRIITNITNCAGDHLCNAINCNPFIVVVLQPATLVTLLEIHDQLIGFAVGCVLSGGIFAEKIA